MSAPEDGLLALADRNRLRLLRLLLEGPRAVGELARAAGLGQSLVSHHLAVLTRAGWLACRRQGRRRLYSVAAGDAARRTLAEWIRRHVRAPGAEATGPAAPAPEPAAPASGSDLEDYLL